MLHTSYDLHNFDAGLSKFDMIYVNSQNLLHLHDKFHYEL